MNYYTEERLNQMLAAAEEIGKMLGSFIIYLNKSEVQGTKFKDRVKATQDSKLKTLN
jgi:hypothetical protein